MTDNTGAGQLQDEMIALIHRYADEGEMSIAECIGTLRIVEAELLARLMESED